MGRWRFLITPQAEDDLAKLILRSKRGLWAGSSGLWITLKMFPRCLSAGTGKDSSSCAWATGGSFTKLRRRTSE